ncbi:MAG: DUF998 domain-containing protein [Bacteroidetes bacterium]|nr:MAG: DUF998 domain-containing protein [Bacteroidota bacterium]
MNDTPDKKTVITLRRAIGILGIILPLVVALGAIILGDCTSIQRSISLYYNTIMRNAFVGILTATALFMFAYRGYDYRDRIAGIAAFVFALGIAFFPATSQMVKDCGTLCLHVEHYSWIRIVHLVSAALYFLTLAYISLFLFTLTDPKLVFTEEKRKRNNIYRICGFVILGSLLLIAIFMGFIFPHHPQYDRYHPIFWLESIALWAFGISWLIKGEVAVTDDLSNP